MEKFQEPKSLVQQFQNSVAAKLFTIGILTLLLLIPSSWIQSIIWEREARQTEVAAEIAEKWSASQLIQGPVIQLPYKTYNKVIESNGKANFKKVSP